MNKKIDSLIQLYLKSCCGYPQKIGHDVSNKQMGVDCITQTSQVPAIAIQQQKMNNNKKQVWTY